MRYDVIDSLTCKEEFNYLPKPVRNEMKKSTSFLICGSTEAEDVACVGVFTVNEKKKENGNLLWIYTKEEYREQGIASGLLAHGEELLAQMGIKNLNCQITATMDLAEEMYEFLVSHGFEMELSNWHIYEYSRKKVEAALENVIPEKNRRTYQHIGSKELHYRLKEDASIPPRMKEIFLQEGEADKSIFLFQNNMLQAGIPAEREPNGDCSICALYIHKDEMENPARLLLILEQIIRESVLSNKKECSVYFCVDHVKYKKLYQKLFGDPEQDYWIQSYKRRIG